MAKAVGVGFLFEGTVMPKAPKKVLIVYIGPKEVEEDTVSGRRGPAGEPVYWRKDIPEFVSLEEAGRLLYYPALWADARTADDKRKFGQITPIAPVDQRYAEQSDEEIAEGLDVMPRVDLKLLDAKGLVHFAGTYLGKRLNVEDGRPKLFEQVNSEVEGARFGWA